MPVRFGELLLRENRITPAQLQDALAYQKVHGGKLGMSFVKLGYLRDREITAVLSKQYGVPCIELPQFEIDPAVIRLVSPETAQKYQVVPLIRSGSILTMAMADPTNVPAMDDIKFMTGCHIEPVIAPEMAVLEAIQKYYANARTGSGVHTLEMAARAFEDLPQVQEVELVPEFEELDADSLERQGAEAPVIRLVNLLLASAIQKGASDIHLETYEREFRVRFRIDGILHSIMQPPMRLRDAVASRIKVMARLDIAEKRLPQDGRIKIRFNDDGSAKEIDFRVSCLPTLFGEKIVLRLLDRGKLMLDMTRLGFDAESLARYEAAIRKPWGMVLVTGPTGSGKTTTLYSSITRINRPETNIMAAEDPVEFNLPGVNQVQVRDNIGLTFATILRSFLRQDPNVILVGEIRDRETAEIAVKAALTGHLVLSTIHTNDAPATISRLMNMGIEPFLVASSTNLICAQRLVRRICASCSVPHPVPEQALLELGFSSEDAARVVPCHGTGCEKCNHSGYAGRTGLYEVMEATDAIRDLILIGAAAGELRKKACEQGMTTLRQSGLRKIRAGLTTIEEVVRETALR